MTKDYLMGSVDLGQRKFGHIEVSGDNFTSGQPFYFPLPLPKLLTLQFKKLHAEASVPKQQRPGDAGYDLACIDVHGVSPGERLLVGTGVAVAIPMGFVGLIRSRSGVAVKQGVEVQAGVIDSNYRGEIKVLLHNTDKKVQWFNAGDRIAQLLVIPIWQGTVEEADELSETDRGEKGFGSSGR